MLVVLQVAYSGTEEEMVKHVLGSHGMPRLHRFLGDVYELDVGEIPEISSPDHQSGPGTGKFNMNLYFFVTEHFLLSTDHQKSDVSLNVEKYDIHLFYRSSAQRQRY